MEMRNKERAASAADHPIAELRLRGDRAAVVFSEAPSSRGHLVFRYGKYFLFPGFADVHVHLREPGFSYKETIAAGTAAAARGGYTDLGSMPNLSPVPDCAEALAAETAVIERDALVSVRPYGAITRGQAGTELADMASMAAQVLAFSDDGRGVQNAEMMRAAMWEASRLGKPIAAHCEDESLLRGGYIHDGEYARLHGHRGISAESEWRQIARDLALARETGCRYHVCHVSAGESVALIRQAKAMGTDVSCETAPHYLLLDDSMLQEDGRFKMNPPIRGKADRKALLEGLLDGTVDMIATDHAPHAASEKSGGLRDSLNGIVGLETAFPVLYTGLVLPGLLPLERLVELMSAAPRARFGFPGGPETGDFTVFDLNARFTVDPEEFLTLGRATPFAGMEVYGRCMLTVKNGNIVWRDGGFAPLPTKH
jgi:dihydroorotase